VQSLKSIMIVDDEKDDVVSIFKFILKRQGNNTIDFADLQEALNEFKMKHEKYALVISDIKDAKNCKPIKRIMYPVDFSHYCS
jgi:DNA-binding NtrC family response regulator